MKHVTVRYFAAYREAVGMDRERLQTGATTVAGLFTELCSRHDRLAQLPRALVAVNDAMVRWDAPVDDDAVVLFFPPVAGG
jgi:molybdopterin synthase sulfur carrier subunit